MDCAFSGELFSLGDPVGWFAFVPAGGSVNSTGPNKSPCEFLDQGLPCCGLVQIWVWL